jgi:CDP-glucose 4,6-dehydratase
VVVTSDKCYENREWIFVYREVDRLGGGDPYSASKACAELVSAAYRRSFFDEGSHAAIATVRAGTVIGGGDWGENRLVPDAMRALRRERPLVVRNPAAVRPWQHVLEPLAGYLMVAERLCEDGTKWAGAWNFGPQPEDEVTVATLAGMVVHQWGAGSWTSVKDPEGPYESRELRLDWNKANQLLGWRPRLRLHEAVAMTLAWYRKAFHGGEGAEMHEFTLKQIEEYASRFC